MDNTKQYDWFASIVSAPNLAVGDFKAAGLNESNTSMGSPDDYRNTPLIQKMFTDEKTGAFNE